MIIHLAQLKTGFEQTDYMLVNLFLANQSTLHSLGQFGVCISETALHVGAGNDTLGS